MLERVIKAILIAIISTLLEQTILPKIGLGFLLEPGGTPISALVEPPLPMVASFLPAGYGLVIVVLTITYLWLTVVGMTVGESRAKYIALAEKDGEKNVAERYEIPNLYAQGTSKHVQAFNCVQRSHQQILETFPGYVFTVLITGLEFPITAFVLASLWLYSRIVWVKGYMASSGQPMQRYSHPFAGFFWHSMLTLIVICVVVGVQLVLGRKIFWDQLLPGLVASS